MSEEKVGNCSCGHPLTIVGPGKYQCEVCDLINSWWATVLENKVVETLFKISKGIDFHNWVRLEDYENKDTLCWEEEVLKIIREEVQNYVEDNL